MERLPQGNEHQEDDSAFKATVYFSDLHSDEEDVTAKVTLHPTDKICDETPLFSFDYNKHTMCAGQLETEERSTI